MDAALMFENDAWPAKYLVDDRRRLLRLDGRRELRRNRARDPCGHTAFSAKAARETSRLEPTVSGDAELEIDIVLQILLDVRGAREVDARTGDHMLDLIRPLIGHCPSQNMVFPFSDVAGIG